MSTAIYLFLTIYLGNNFVLGILMDIRYAILIKLTQLFSEAFRYLQYEKTQPKCCNDTCIALIVVYLPANTAISMLGVENSVRRKVIRKE